MVKTTMSEERLRQLVRKIVREELEQAVTDRAEDSQRLAEQPRKRAVNTASISDNGGPWAVFGPPKPDPAKNFKRLERPRALPGWSEPYQDGDEPSPYRPKRSKK